MPTTVNGVGTHYWGSRNAKWRVGVCRQCGVQTDLVSYDTRLFFVILFIPIIPLGRKRIIDECSKCRRHYAVDAKKWEVSGQLNASDAIAQFDNDPSPETAARCHAQLLAYMQYEEATTLREKALAAIPDDGSLKADLGWQLHAAGQYRESLDAFDAALALRPDLPSARAGKSRYLMGEGKLDEARDILDFLREPGAAQVYEMGPLITLCDCYLTAKRPDDALALVPHLLDELPHLKDDFVFRNIVRKAERAAGRPESLLPARKRTLSDLLFSDSRAYSPGQRKAAWAAVVTIGLIAAFALHNEAVRRRRTVHIVNALGVPATVRIDGGNPVQVDRLGSIVVAEGEHQVEVSGPVQLTETLAVHSGYFERWLRRPVWVVNVNGEAILVESRLVYSRIAGPPRQTLHLGRTTLSLPDVDYFLDEDPPETMQVKGNRSVEKTQLQIVEVQLESAFASLFDLNPSGALTLAEKRLARSPDKELLEAYLKGVRSPQGDRERGARYLEAPIERRPIEVEWHRAYQDLRDTAAGEAGLIARYRDLVAQNPQSAAAWYLLGRIEPDVAARDRANEKAVELDPQLSWGYLGRANRAIFRHRFDEAEAAHAKVLEQRPEDDSTRMSLIDDLLAQKKYDAVDELCRDWKVNGGLTAIHIRSWTAQCRGEPVDVGALVAEGARAYPADSAPQVRLALAAWLNYAARKWDELRTVLQNPQLTSLSPKDKAFLLLSRTPKEVLRSQFPSPSAIDGAMDVLAISLALSLEGDDAMAAIWRQRAIERLQAGDRSERRIAAALAGDQPLAHSEFEEVWISPHHRSIVCVMLARQFPDERAAWFDEARVWQLFPVHHYWLVDRALNEP